MPFLLALFCIASGSHWKAKVLALPPHPRIKLDKAGLDFLDQNVKNPDSYFKQKLDGLQKYADSLVSLPPVNCSMSGVESTMLTQARAVLDMQSTLGLASRLFPGKSKTYSERATAEMLHVIRDCPNWNPINHFLDTAEMLHAVAIGYDWLYGTLSPADRKTIEQGALNKGLRAGLVGFLSKAWWTTTDNNWNLVCNGGLLVGAIAFLDVPEIADVANEVIASASKYIPIALANYGPNGGWYEGAGYWAYGTKYLVAAITSAQINLGTDFGWLAQPGLQDTGLFAIYSYGPSNISFNWADSGEGYNDPASLFHLARLFPSHQREYAQSARLVSGCSSEICSLEILYYGAEGTLADLEKLPTSKFIEFQEWNPKIPPRSVGFFRSRWIAPASSTTGAVWDSKAAWLGFKAGRGAANHNDLDSGDFVFEMGGRRWAIDLGPDNYGMPAYFGAKRFTYYRKATRGQNTISFGGWDGNVVSSNQNEKEYSSISVFNGTAASSACGPFALVNMTPVYSGHGITSVVRGFAFLNDYKALLVVDEFTMSSNATLPPNVTWTMHTRANITAPATSSVATLDINGVNLRAELLTGSITSSFSALALQLSPPQYSTAGINKLTVDAKVKAGTSTIAVVFSLSLSPVTSIKPHPLSQWKTSGPVAC